MLPMAKTTMVVDGTAPAAPVPLDLARFVKAEMKKYG